jgi:hypothetical protein
MKRERRIDITFSEDQIDIFDKLKALAKSKSQTVQQVLKNILAMFFSK